MSAEIPVNDKQLAMPGGEGGDPGLIGGPGGNPGRAGGLGGDPGRNERLAAVSAEIGPSGGAGAGGGKAARVCAYGVSLAGPSHIQAGRPCQDSYAIAVAGDYLVLAVADGIGSQAHSDIGAAVAVQTCVATCARFVGECRNGEERLELIRASFAHAYDMVLGKADELHLDPGQMDCTLCCVLWDAVGKLAYVGQSGDSGAACAQGDGSYRLMTSKQNDADGAVYCLCFDDHWEFAQVDDVWSVMLCTDGVLDAIIASPRLAQVAYEPRFNGGSLVDARMAHAFLHPYMDEAEADPLAGLMLRAKAYLEGYPRALLDDDKTVLVAFREDEPPALMPEPYYDGPDWEAIEQDLAGRLYPQRSIETGHAFDVAPGAVADAAEVPAAAPGAAAVAKLVRRTQANARTFGPTKRKFEG